MIIKILAVMIVVVIAFIVFMMLRAKFVELSRGMKAVNRVNGAIGKLGTDPEAAGIEIKNLAADPEYRNTLYDGLNAAGKPELFPKEFLNQEAFAESDLVFWLCHPNELKNAPDEIELSAKVRKQLSEETGEAGFYVFRFRVNEPHWAAKNGWMAGITGPYIAGGEVQTRARGTFSELEPYGSRTPEEHVDYLLSKQGSFLVTGTRV